MQVAFGLKAKEVSGFGVRGYFKQTSAVSSMGWEGSLPASWFWLGETASLVRIWGSQHRKIRLYHRSAGEDVMCSQSPRLPWVALNSRLKTSVLLSSALLFLHDNMQPTGPEAGWPPSLKLLLCIYTPMLTPGPIYRCPGGSVVKNPSADAGDPCSIPGSGRSPGEGNGYALQYACLENPMDRGAWRGTICGVARVGHNLVTKQEQRPTYQPQFGGNSFLIFHGRFVHLWVWVALHETEFRIHQCLGLWSVYFFRSFGTFAAFQTEVFSAAKLLQSRPTQCDPIDSSPPGSPVPGILQARPLEWVAIAFSKSLFWVYIKDHQVKTVTV